MRAKNLALRVLSTAAMLSIVTSIAAPAFAATYYINDGSVDVAVSKDGIVTVEQGGVTYTDGLDSVVIRGGTRSEGEKDDRTEVGASPATQEADGSNTPAVSDTQAPKSENTAGDTAPKQETTAAEERKEDTPQQELTEEKAEEKVTPEQKPTEKEAEEKVTPEPAKAKAEAPKAAQEPSAEQEEQKEQEEEQEEQQEKEDEPTVPSAAPLVAASAAQADNSSTSTPAERTDNVITIVNNFAKKAFSFVLDNVNIDRSQYDNENHKSALTVKGDGDTEIELDGDNVLKGGYSHAGLEKTDHDGKGSLTIKDDNEKAGSLTAVGGEDGAAIGGSYHWDDSTVADTRNIKITGGTINAFGGDEAAGIGAGKYGYADNIEITGDAVVTAHGRQRGATIGGGFGTGADITISGNATVAADAYNGAPAIGSGGENYYKTVGERANTTIRIKDNAKVTAIGSYDSAAIGTGSYFDYKNTGKTTIEISGGTITAVAGSNSAAIGRGNNSSANVSVTVTGDTGNTTIDAACKLDQECAIGGGKDNGDAIDSASSFGEQNGVVVRFYKNSAKAINYLKDLKNQVLGQQYKLLHNAQWWVNNGYTSEPSTDTTHAWMVDDTKERVEPTLEHEGHVYYKCSVPGCKAVHDEVLPKLEQKPTPEPTPDPTPVQPEPTPVPTPDPAPVQPDTPADNQNTAEDDVSTPKLYVIDLANTQVLFDETRQNDTVTYTTKQDGASLTGSFEALEAMAADGVKTIVFQTIGTNTPGAVSRVSVNALLQHGGETLLLTHNGTEVHLTIDGQNADSLLLQ
mgnify:CR=1 FL=1